ncbi:PepSY domain-containing protein [Paenibacillus sp. IHBB 10380]|uniref:PepSY domain-containing protein n=1 Tax=Paenibacillus sp. IHBB 10380 TaxID=1566358 RepID=UPI0005CFDFC6|nr:PepSY domain-containing protein [Paenibacillus sp. IHBB 10380]AJS59360.1 hypothetical protein UB51_13805 [Paenibacillus sp. IHBB 10380]
MNKKIGWISSAVLIIAVVVTLGTVWKSWANSPDILSEEEVIRVVLAEYPGEIVNTSLENDAYRIQVQLEKGLYELRVNAGAGGITSIKRLEAVVPDELQPDEVPNPKPNVDKPHNNPTTGSGKGSSNLVTSDKAIALALKQVPGNVQEVEFRGKDANRYYLVEIDTEDGREAVVQVNGISGAIMSVTWDDDDNDN